MKLNTNATILLRHELIGLKIKVVNSSHKELCGINGTIIDETKNTLVVERDDRHVSIVPKKYSIFQIKLPDGTRIEIEGRLLLGRPEDRIKKRR